MVITCDIIFDKNPNGIYYAGQMLTGFVTFKTDKLKEVKCIALKVSGLAYTRWTSDFDNDDSYWGREDYIKSKVYLLGSNDDTSNHKIDSGSYNYNFACPIPVTCPSSFQGRYGYVRYSVKVVLERPWKFDQSFTRCFTVMNIMDLNCQDLELTAPNRTEVVKTTRGSSGSQPMKFQLSLPQSGFVPGQEISVGVLATNNTSVLVEEIKITLAMCVHYKCQNLPFKRKMERLVIAKLKGEGVMCQCTKSFVYPIRVPATPPTHFNSGHLIEITYNVELEAKLKGWHRNVHAAMPVVIGNVPLVDGKALMQQKPSTSSDTSASAQVKNMTGNSLAAEGAQDSAIKPWAVDESIPPPSYEQAMHLGSVKLKDDKKSNESGFKRNEVGDNGELNFVPLYPVFNIPISPVPNQTSVGEAKGTQ